MQETDQSFATRKSWASVGHQATLVTNTSVDDQQERKRVEGVEIENE
jgi:hypothetical protein